MGHPVGWYPTACHRVLATRFNAADAAHAGEYGQMVHAARPDRSGSAGGCGLQPNWCRRARRRRRLLRSTSGAQTRIAVMTAAGALRPQGLNCSITTRSSCFQPATRPRGARRAVHWMTKILVAAPPHLASQTPRCVRCNLGLPGSPVLNRAAVVGDPHGAPTARPYPASLRPKNYFYPDMPKNYQIHSTRADRHQRLPGRAFEDGTTWRVEIERAHIRRHRQKATHIGGSETAGSTVPPVR